MPHKVSTGAIARGHEGDGLREKAIAFTAFCLAAATPFLMAGLWLQFRASEGAHYRGLRAPTLLETQSQPQFALPEPRLIIHSGADMGALRTQEDVELNSYGWIDRSSNIVRIPIARAMELVAQRGLPAPGGKDAGLSEYDLILAHSRQRQEAPIKESK